MLRYKLEEIQHQTDLSKLNVSPSLVFCTFYNKFRVLFQIRTIIFVMLWTWSIPELCIMYVVMELLILVICHDKTKLKLDETSV